MAAQKLTKNQALVLDLLKQQARPFTAYNILDQLREQGLKAPPQVYRALETLLEKGLVHRLESENAYVACVQPGCADGHNHGHAIAAFAICEECGSASEFEGAEVDQIVRTWAGRKGFETRRTVLELRGLCQECAP